MDRMAFKAAATQSECCLIWDLVRCAISVHKYVGTSTYNLIRGIRFQTSRIFIRKPSS